MMMCMFKVLEIVKLINSIQVFLCLELIDAKMEMELSAHQMNKLLNGWLTRNFFQFTLI